MKILIFDTETTGLCGPMTLPLAQQPSITEFFCCTLDTETGEISDEVGMLIKPPKPVSAEITRITGITNEMLKEAQSFAETTVADTICNQIEFAENVCAHNASFDVQMINMEFLRLEQTIKWPRVLCSVEQSISLCGYRLTLQGLHEHLFGEKFKEAHRARNDVMALVRCVQELVKRGEI